MQTRFNRKGWLQRYLDFRGEHPFPSRLPSEGVRIVEEGGVHHEMEEAIYYFLQPTGLLYGFPVQPPFPMSTYAPLGFNGEQPPVTVIFIEALLACLVSDRHYLLENLVDEGDHLPSAVRTAQAYFNYGFTPRGVSALPGLRRLFQPTDVSDVAKFESGLTTHLERRHDRFKRENTYFNSFLFLDLYNCVLWQREVLVNPDAADTSMESLAIRQTIHRDLLIRLMIAAGFAGGEIGSPERRLIEWFLKSADLPPDWQRRLRTALKQGLTLGEIEIPDLPWLVRRFMLEAVMMTVLIDRDFTDTEESLLHQVVRRLELWEGEFNQSLMALEVFLIHQGADLAVLRDRPVMTNVAARFSGHATAALRKNLDRIVNEIRETQELYNLMIKSTHTVLTPEEKRKVRAQLMDIVKTIPALAIFALPGGAVILPILIKLLPFNLLPSSFED